MEKYDVEVDDIGTIRFYKQGTQLLHRLDGPAVEYADGIKFWRVDGKLSRLDGPAVEYADGSKFWYVDDVKLTEKQFKKKTATKELTVAEIEKLLGHRVKIVK